MARTSEGPYLSSFSNVRSHVPATSYHPLPIVFESAKGALYVVSRSPLD